MYRIGVSLTLTGSFPSLFSNGIYQNGLTMFELLKLCKNVTEVYIVCFEKLEYLPPQLEKYREYIITFDQCLDKIDVFLVLTSGIGNVTSSILKSKNIKIVFQIMGTEYHVFNEYICFNTNLVNVYKKNPIDAVWISPHIYKPNKDFLEIVYDTKALIAPYVWSPYFLEESLKMIGKYEYTPTYKNSKKISTFEPNLNYVKTSLTPTIIAEKMHMKYPDLIEKVSMFCSDKLYERPHFVEFITDKTIYQNKKLFFERRFPIVFSLFEHTDIVLAHQRDLEYNYLYFDAAWLGFPLVHNSDSLKDLGYYYPDFDAEKATDVLKYVCENFDNEYKEYLTKSREYISKFLYNNQENIDGYTKLIDNLFQNN
jgi:hypothetical protein